MEIGIFSKVFDRPTLEGVLDAVAAHDFHYMQFNMLSAGLPTLPDEIDPALAERIHAGSRARDISMSALTATFNMIHPDRARVEQGLRRLEVLAASAGLLGTSLLTLCTGTRDPDNQWRWHPGNSAPDAWRDLVWATERALRIAERHSVTLGIEPEVSNVVDSPAMGRRLIEEMGSPRLRAIMDPANIFKSGDLARMPEVLDGAFEELGPYIVLAHAKDLVRDGEAGQQAAGTGRLDFGRYLALLRAAGYDGPLILHGLAEAQVDLSVGFLRDKLG